MSIQSSADDWKRNSKIIVQWSPYESKEDLFQQVFPIGSLCSRKGWILFVAADHYLFFYASAFRLAIIFLCLLLFMNSFTMRFSGWILNLMDCKLKDTWSVFLTLVSEWWTCLLNSESTFLDVKIFAVEARVIVEQGALYKKVG